MTGIRRCWSTVVVLGMVVLASTLVTLASAQRLTEGDDCELYDGSPGVCVGAEKCPTFERDIADGNYPPVCEFKHLTPIVCCVSNSRPRPTPPPPRPPTKRPTTRPPVRPRPQTPRPAPRPPPTRPPTTTTTTTTSLSNRISRRKCAEYSQKQTSPGLIVFPLLVGADEYVDKDEKKCASQVPFVVGGEQTGVGEFPHMAALGYTIKGVRQFVCGGSLISDRFVLTAAHCLSPSNAGPVEVVRLGEHNFDRTDDSTHVDVDVEERIPHPRYQPPSSYHDLALLRLARSVDYLQPRIRPACLPTPDTLRGIREAIATGWGHTLFAGDPSPYLKKVGLRMVSRDKCDEVYPSGRPQLINGIVDGQLCAGDERGNDTCQGDSGGPLQVFDPELCSFDIVGITSIGQFCGAGAPGIYTRVSHYVDWIEKQVWN